MNKVCSKCKETKPLSAFSKRAASKDGFNFKCKVCMKAASAAWESNNIEKVKAKRKERYRTHKDEALVAKRAWVKANPDKLLEYHLKHRYGISLENYRKAFTQQGGKCAICSTHEDQLSTRICVDHNHRTGEMRGLLCKNCNLGVGYFAESVERLEAAIKYLKAKDL